jgi:hypothetical protein
VLMGALTITSPVAGDVWNSTGDHTIKWTSTSYCPLSVFY